MGRAKFISALCPLRFAINLFSDYFQRIICNCAENELILHSEKQTINNFYWIVSVNQEMLLHTITLPKSKLNVCYLIH